MNQAFSEAT